MGITHYRIDVLPLPRIGLFSLMAIKYQGETIQGLYILIEALDTSCFARMA